MAGVRGRGFSTGKALSILFKIIADGSQARREIGKTSQDATQQIRSVETLLQRALSVISRPVRGRLGLAGSLGISLLRENLRGLADREIKKVREELGETEKAAKKAAKAGTSAGASLTSVGAALLAIRSKPAAQQIQNLSKEYADATFAIKTFEGVINRTLQPDTTKKIKQFGPQVASGDTLKALLKQSGVTPSRIRSDDFLGEFGISFRNKAAEEALAEFQKGFNLIPNSVTRAAVAFRVFGADTAKMLPILEQTRTEATDAAKQFEQAAKKVATMEQAQREVDEAKILLSKKRTEALEAETRAIKLAEKAEEHRLAQAIFPLEQKKTDKGDLLGPAVPLGKPGRDREPDWLLKRLGLIDKGLDLEQVDNMLKLEAQKVADVERGNAILKENERLLAESSKAYEQAQAVAARARGNLPKAEDDFNRVANAIQRAKDEADLLQREADKLKVTEFAMPWAASVENLEKKVASLRAEAEALNPALIKMNERQEELKDATVLADRAVDSHVKVMQHDKEAVETSRRALEKYNKTLALDPVQKARTLDRMNTETITTQATEAATVATALKNVQDKAQIDLLAKEAIAAEATAAALGELGAVITLTTAETHLLNRALKETGGKGGTAALLDAVKKLNTVKAPVGGVGPVMSALDPAGLAKVESFLTKLGLMSTDAEKAAFAVESVGEAFAAELLPAVGATAPAAEAATTAFAGLGATLIPVAIGIAAVTAAAGALLLVAFLVAKKVAENDALIGRLAERTGLTAENLSALDNAAKKANLGGIKSIQERIGSFQRILGQVARGQLPETAFMFKKLGIDSQTGAQDINGSLIKIINAYNSMEDEGQKAVLMQQAFEDRTGKVALALQESGPDFEKYKDHLRDMERLLSDEGARSALEFNRQLKGVGAQFSALGAAFGRPIIQMQGFQLLMRVLTTDIKGLGTVVKILGTILGAFVLGLAGLLAGVVAQIQTFSEAISGGFLFNPKKFGDTLIKNAHALMNFNQEVKKSEEEMNQEFDDTLKREEQRTKTAIQLKEQERDARAAIEQSITDDYKRQVELRTKTKGEAAQQEQRQLSADTQKQLDITMEAWRKEAIRTTDGSDEAQDQKMANLKGFQQKVNELLLSSQGKNADIITAELVRQREEYDEWQQQLLDTSKAFMELRVSELQEEANRDVRVRQEKLEEIKTLEEEQTAKELAEIQRRMDMAEQDSVLRNRLATEHIVKSMQAQQEANDRTREIAEAGYAARRADLQLYNMRVQTAIIDNQTHIDAIRDAAARRNVTRANQPSTIYAKKDLDQAKAVENALQVQVNNLTGAFKDATKARYDLSIATTDVLAKEKALSAAVAAEQAPITLVKSIEEAHITELKVFQDKIDLKKKEKKIQEDEKKDTRQVAEEIEQIESEKVAAIQRHGRDIRDAYITQANDVRNIMQETTDILRNARQQQIQTTITHIQRQADYIGISMRTRKAGIRKETELNLESANINHQSQLDELKRKVEILAQSNLTDEEYLEREEALHQAREAELRRHAQEVVDIILDGKKKEREAWRVNDPFEQGLAGANPFEGYRQRAEENFLKTGKSAMKMGDIGKMGLGILGGAVNQLAEATGSLVENWVIMGTAGPAAMRKMTAQILASLAKQATVEAIMELARGFAALARAFFGDPKAGAEAAMHFKSAALFGAVAAVAAVGGRAVAGDLFAEKSKEATTKDAEKEKEEIEKKNEGRRQFVEHIHRVVVTGEKGFVARQFAEEVKNNNPEVRRAINTAAK